MRAHSRILAVVILGTLVCGAASAQTVDPTIYAWQFPVVSGANAPCSRPKDMASVASWARIGLP
jgi:hypothetical protein